MAEREITWTTRALRDRTDILDYWYRKTMSVDYPVKLVKLFTSTLSLLARHPQSGTSFDAKRNIRFRVVRYYRIYYTFSDNRLTVLSIWDTRRNQASYNI